MTHLDTSFLIRALVAGSREDRQLRDWLATEAPIAMSAVAWAEFLCGPLAPRDLSLAAAVVGEAVPLTADHAARAARPRAAGTGVPALLVRSGPSDAT